MDVFGGEPDNRICFPAAQQTDLCLEPPMTLIVAALASDGVVMASDSRETFPNKNAPELAYVRDDQKKVLHIGQVLIGVAGLGASVKGADLGQPASALEAMQTLHNFVLAGTIPNAFECLAVSPAERIVILSGRNRLPPLPLDDRWRCLGVCPLAEWFLRLAYSPAMTAVEVAAVCAAAIRATVSKFPAVGGLVQISAQYTDDARTWGEQDATKAREQCERWVEHAKGFKWDPA
jgi:hypothetical protein